MIALFDWLSGASPWWWIAFGVALMALEMATLSFFLIWPGIAAAIIGLTLFVAPGMSGSAQVTLFAALSVALTWSGRLYIRRRGQLASDRPGLNRRSMQMVGRRCTALTAFKDGHGSIEIDGVHWPSRVNSGDDPQEAEHLRVSGVDGMTLIVERSAT